MRRFAADMQLGDTPASRTWIGRNTSDGSDTKKPEEGRTYTVGRSTRDGAGAGACDGKVKVEAGRLK